MKKEVPKQEEEIKKMEEKPKLQLKAPTSYWIYYSCYRPFTYVIYIVM